MVSELVLIQKCNRNFGIDLLMIQYNMLLSADKLNLAFYSWVEFEKIKTFFQYNLQLPIQ